MYGLILLYPNLKLDKTDVANIMLFPPIMQINLFYEES